MRQALILGLLAVVAAPVYADDHQAEIDRAVSNGVRALRQLQHPDGTWPHTYIGATALAGLTLLECGAKEDDKDVLRAADAVRKASIDLTNTYSLSLSILFLDRLGDSGDEPFIQSLMVRLLAGQDNGSGGWSYDCPPIGSDEKQRLQSKLNERKDSEGKRDRAKSEKKRNGDEVSPEIRDQLDRLERARQMPQQGGVFPGFPQIQPGGAAGMPLIMGGSGDNSNTQFAAIGIWVGHRHGVPIERALARLDRRFRSTQLDDGGWSYMPSSRPPGMPANALMPFNMGSSAAMTCSGLLGLALADGATLELAQKRKPDAKLPDISKDENLNRGLQALGAVIDNPRGLRLGPRGPFMPPQPPDGAFGRVGGKTYYFLWSLERVAVALDLKTIGKKDWYGWGTEILLESQMPDGSWNGDYGAGGVDTCFALLFLRRANFVGDLTKRLKGRVSDPGDRTLRAGPSRKALGKKAMKSGIETTNAKPLEKPVLKGTGTESGRLAEDLLKAAGARRLALLESMESEKGVKYTEALAAAIPHLDGETHRRARVALANRLTRMKDDTLVDYLSDDDAEIRRAAAIAIGQKDSKARVPDLISLLRDPDVSVVRAAHASLKSLTQQDFGPAATATREERDHAFIKWVAWWDKQRKKN